MSRGATERAFGVRLVYHRVFEGGLGIIGDPGVAAFGVFVDVRPDRPTAGAALARRVEWKALPGYWIVQVIGGLLAGLLIYLIAKGKDGFTATGNMAANGF